MKLSATRIVMLLAGIVAASPVYADSHENKFIFEYVGKSPGGGQDYQLERAIYSCDDTVGVQTTAMSAAYRACMTQRGWKYSYVTKQLVKSRRAGSCDDCDGPTVYNSSPSSSPPVPSGPSQDSIDSFNNSQQMLIQQYDNSFMPQPYVAPN